MVAYPDMIFDDDWLNMLYMRVSFTSWQSERLESANDYCCTTKAFGIL